MIPAEELGLGVQSAVVVGVFEAMRLLGGPVGTIVIEEPEMYLHPQAQRYLYRLLTEMADRGDCQVVYASHSPVFADATRFDDIRLARREPGGSTTVSYVKEPADIEYLEGRRAGQKLLSTFDPARSEVFFARRVLAVEGKGDQLAARLVAQRLKMHLDAENLAVIDCGAKSAIPFIARTCSALGIPLLALHDEDIYPEEGDEGTRRKIREQNADAEKENAEIRAAVPEDRLFIMQPSLEGALGIGRSAPQKPRRVLERVRDLPVDELPASLVAAVEALAAQNSSTPGSASAEASHSGNSE